MYAARLIALSLCLSLLAPSALGLLGLLPCAMGQAHASASAASAASVSIDHTATEATPETASVPPCHGRSLNAQAKAATELAAAAAMTTPTSPAAIAPTLPIGAADSCCTGCGVICAAPAAVIIAIELAERMDMQCAETAQRAVSMTAVANLPPLRPPIVVIARS